MRPPENAVVSLGAWRVSVMAVAMRMAACMVVAVTGAMMMVIGVPACGTLRIMHVLAAFRVSSSMLYVCQQACRLSKEGAWLDICRKIRGREPVMVAACLCWR